MAARQDVAPQFVEDVLETRYPECGEQSDFGLRISTAKGLSDGGDLGRNAIQKSLSTTIRLLLVALLAPEFALAQQPAQALRGTWIATAGRGKVLHGTWAGGTSPHRPNVAEGTWTLTNAGQMILEGTWRAEKNSRSWEGRWSGRTAMGESISGSWGADLEHWHGKTLQEMLERTLQEQVSGWWQSGRAGGNWWLKGPQRPSR